MARFLVIGVVVAVALSIFTFVDIALTEGRRVRGVPKGFWFFIALLPVIGAILWFVVGKEPARPVRYLAPDDDPSFLTQVRLDEEQEERIRQLERELADLDAEENADDDSDNDSKRP
jgi:hypothetical protein